MKKYIIALGLIAPAFLFGQIDRSIRPTAGKAPAINIKDSEVFTSSNGITVILSENHKIPKVSFSLTTGNSPILEGDKAGLSQLAGELITSGTKNRSKDQLDKEIDYIGAEFSASSQSIYVSCLTKHLNKGLDLFSDVLLNANFPQNEFERVKKQTVSSLMSVKSSPDAMAGNAESKANFPKNHPASEIMTEQTLNNINLDDIKNYYKSVFIPKGSYLVIVGDINKQQALEAVEKYLATWKGETLYKAELPSPLTAKNSRVIFVKKPGAVQSVINITFPMDIKPGDKDQLPLTVMNDILGGGSFGSRFFQNLREDKAYTYGCYSSLNINENGSSFSASGSFRNEVTDSAITQLLYEMERITNSHISDDELSLTKMAMAGNFSRSLEKPQTIARFALNIIKYNLSKDYYQTYLKRLEAISKEDVLTMAQKYINFKGCNIIVVGNEEVLDKIKKFDTDGKVEIWDAFGNEVKETKKADISKEQLLEKYVLAMTQSTSLKNSNKILKKIKAYEQVTEISIAQAPFPLSSTSVWMTPNIEASKLEAQGMVFQKSYFDGKTGGSFNPQTGKKALEADEITAKNKSIGLLPELNYATSGMTYELIGIENIDGKEVYVLKLNDGKTESYDYFDTKSFLKIRSTKIEKNEGESIEVTTNYSDYKAVNGVLFPHKILLNQGEMSFDMTIKTITVKSSVDIKPFM